jgi:hypothetical protein
MSSIAAGKRNSSTTALCLALCIRSMLSNGKMAALGFAKSLDGDQKERRLWNWNKNDVKNAIRNVDPTYL